MVGAGISTSAGIPDFRSPDKGIYSKLAKYNLPDPQAIFDIDYFKKRPEAFYDLAKELIPKVLKPTIAHCFIKLLELKGVLLRHYTQNKWLKQEMESTKVPTCVPCGGIVKPDIVFFGESLPKRFFEYMAKDFYEADLLIIMGSTLVVQPFASLVRRVHRKCPRIIINDKKVGATVGITYKAKYNTRDVFIKGKCDDGCKKIATSLGWEAELNDLVEQYQIEANSSQ
ncbi:hypothetical protein O3M35_005314 [Rhynocoris fuscipes]|uniref:protein acetyllysine N-acetyltransferase n=1 Tax=Rhynocoris fuscipes TaxID=488301 RepID=A0AAW1DQ08_9HEMI